MKHWWEDLKKIGAGITIVLLALMMTLMFSGQPIDEITGVFTGRAGAGGFAGEVIPMGTYAEVDAGCRDRIRQMTGGQAPEYFVRQCVSGQLKMLYVLPHIGHEVGIDVPKKKIQEDMAELARRQFEAQDENTHPDDRLSMQELYNRLLQQSSVDLQRRSEVAEQVRRHFGTDFPEPRDLGQAEEMTREITLSLRLVRYTSDELLASIGGEVNVSEEEIRLAFEKEQDSVPEEKRKKYEDERKFVKNRLVQERKQAELSKVKQQLGDLKGDVKLEDVVGVTGIRPVTPGRVALDGLSRVDPRDGSGPLNLAIPGVLLDLGRDGEVFVSGPHTVGSSTVYAEISDIRVPEKYRAESPRSVKAEAERAVDADANEGGNRLAASLFNYLVEQAANRGRFELYVPNQSPGGNPAQ